MKINRPAETLCETCGSGVVIRDETGIRQVLCRAGMDDHPIRYRVVECSSYYDRNKTERGDYEKTAWIIVPSGGSGDRIGFLRPGTTEHKQAVSRRAVLDE